jgi:nitrogen regulatory protein P-II 1
MKRVEAVIAPWSLDEFKEAAPRLGISEFTIVEVHRSCGKTMGSEKRLYRGNEYTVDFLPRLKLEFVLFDEDVQTALHELGELIHPEAIVVFQLDQTISSLTDELTSSSLLSRVSNRQNGAVISQHIIPIERNSEKDSEFSSDVPLRRIAAIKIGRGG